MKISEIKSFPVWVGRNQLVVKAETDEGIYGWGESGLSGRELAVVGGVEFHVADDLPLARVALPGGEVVAHQRDLLRRAGDRCHASQHAHGEQRCGEQSSSRIELQHDCGPFLGIHPMPVMMAPLGICVPLDDYMGPTRRLQPSYRSDMRERT